MVTGALLGRRVDDSWRQRIAVPVLATSAIYFVGYKEETTYFPRGTHLLYIGNRQFNMVTRRLDSAPYAIFMACRSFMIQLVWQLGVFAKSWKGKEMILKEPDVKSAAIVALEKLMLSADKEQQAILSRELRMVGSGTTNESEPAYLINSHFGHCQNIVVIHDLRLELEDGSVANIDHLLIHRSFRFYLLESKHFSQRVKISDHGEFLRWNGWSKTFVRTSSPIEQNQRSVAVLRQILKSFGVSDPHIQSFVLLAPDAHIERPDRFDTEEVVSADQFMDALGENLEVASFLGLLAGPEKTPSSESVFTIARRLIALHRPLTIQYAEKTWLNEIFPARKDSHQPNSNQPLGMQANP